MGDHGNDLQAYVVTRLDEAIENGWLRAYYQPVVRTVSGKLCGMEALVRWDDPEHGLLPPAVFIEALEQARVIHLLDTFMVREVCRQMRESINSGVPVVPVSVNLSRLDFDLCDIHHVIEQTVREFEVPRNFVNIEITESVFGTDPVFMAAVIDRFHDIGYQVWMDDFGSAYSSLNVLKDFDFDEMKIDMGFLSRFGEKSRTIIASVVDMAKRLGIQTLAEGVETREHAEFLRHIGCEKQQGYFYGRPEPYSDELMQGFARNLQIEEQGERKYYRTIGSVNTLSLSERDFMPDNMTQDYVTSMPLAFVEFDGEHFGILDCNAPFMEALGSIGIESVERAETIINDVTRLQARTARRLIGTIARDKFARQDYILSGVTCVMRAKYVSSYGNRTTVLVTIDSAAITGERRRRERMEEAFDALYSIYEHIDVLSLDEGRSEPVYSQASFKHVYDIPDLHEAILAFADNELFPADRERYLAFMDIDTMLERIDASGQNYVVGFFRMHDRGGDYVWKLVALIRVADPSSHKVMACIRDTNWDNDALFQQAYEQGEELLPAAIDDADLRVSDGSLWRAIVNDPQFALFWKDADRRFIGCNRAFLDYYGFESVEDIRGKNDEEMGWHVDPVPFMQDELRVVNEGVSIESAVGQCIAHGELRDIVASKRPVYRNGRIVGLVGYFIDVTDTRVLAGQMDMVSYTDQVTGLLNYGGLDAATGRCIEAYKKTGVDFHMLMLDIEGFAQFAEQHGYDFGDKVLRRAAEVIREVVGVTCVLGHIYADRFVVLRQGASQAQMEELGYDIVEALSAVARVDGVPCTLYTRFAIVSYAEAGDFDEFKRLGRARLHNLRVASGK